MIGYDLGHLGEHISTYWPLESLGQISLQGHKGQKLSKQNNKNNFFVKKIATKKMTIFDLYDLVAKIAQGCPAASKWKYVHQGVLNHIQSYKKL